MTGEEAHWAGLGPEDCEPEPLSPSPEIRIPGMPKLHLLKIWPIYFEAVLDGRKRFELRKNDREFQVGDTLRLREWNPSNEEYTGEYVDVRVTYIAQDVFGLPKDVCVMSFESTESSPEIRYQLRNWHHVTCAGFGGNACTCLEQREKTIAELAARAATGG